MFDSMSYNKKPAGCNKWNSPHHQTDYTELTNSVQINLLGMGWDNFHLR